MEILVNELKKEILKKAAIYKKKKDKNFKNKKIKFKEKFK